MKKYLEISLQNIDEVREAIDLDKKQRENENFIIITYSGYATPECILALIKAGYTINKYSDRLQFKKQ